MDNAEKTQSKMIEEAMEFLFEMTDTKSFSKFKFQLRSDVTIRLNKDDNIITLGSGRFGGGLIINIIHSKEKGNLALLVLSSGQADIVTLKDGTRGAFFEKAIDINFILGDARHILIRVLSNASEKKVIINSVDKQILISLFFIVLMYGFIVANNFL